MDLINKYLQEQTPGYEYEYNYEGDMAKTQLNMMIDASMELKSMLANDTNLPEWVQSKITKAADYIDSARDYMKNMNKDSNGNMHNEPMGEETKDTGWQKAQTDRKDQYGNRIKNVARRLARQGMQAAVKDLKKGPEAGKRQVEEVEELDEISKMAHAKYRSAARADIRTQAKMLDADGKASDRIQKRVAGLARSTGLERAKSMVKEEVELDELSKSTLASYAKKATQDARMSQKTAKDFERHELKSKKPEYKAGAKEWKDKYQERAFRRQAGANKAIDRLAKEDVELGEELSSSQRDTHFSLMNKHSLLAKSAKGANKDAHRMAALDHQMALRNPENSQSRSKALSLSNKLGVKEDADLISKYTKLGEAKYPGFRVRMTPGVSKLPRRGYGYVPQGDTDPRTGLPLGFSNPSKKDEPKKEEPPKKTS